MEKRTAFLLFVNFVLVVLLTFFVSSINSSIYNMSTVVSDGGNNASTPTYAQVTVVGEISGNTSAALYSTGLGFLSASLGDIVAPDVTIILPTATTYTSASISFEVATDEISTCDYSLNSGVTNTTMVANSSNTGFTATATLANAAYTANFYCSDLFGNLNYSESVAFTVSVPASPVTSSGSGGGGGGAPLIVAEKINFEVDPEFMTETIVLNRIKNKEFTITNKNNILRNFELEVVALEEIVELNQTSVSLAAYESKQIPFRIHAPSEPGVYAGKINLKFSGIIKSLNLILNVITEKSLFDITLKIPQLMKTMSVGTNLKVHINMIQMGLREKMDVTLNYVIKDFEGNVYLSESETIAVFEKADIEKEFYTENFATGDYVVGVELIYLDGVAVASSHFKIKDGFSFDNLSWIISAVAVIVVLSFVFFVIQRYKRKGRHNIKKKR